MELASALKQNEEGVLATALERAAATGLNTGLVQEAQRRLDGLRRASDLADGCHPRHRAGTR